MAANGRIDVRAGGLQHAPGDPITPVRHVMVMQRPSGGTCAVDVHHVTTEQQIGRAAARSNHPACSGPERPRTVGGRVGGGCLSHFHDATQVAGADRMNNRTV
jgi:hypothetical protein